MFFINLDEKSNSGDESLPPPRRAKARPPVEPRKQNGNRKGRAPRPISSDQSDSSDDSTEINRPLEKRRGRQNPHHASKPSPVQEKPRPNGRRMAARDHRESEYSDFDSNEDECSNDYTADLSPRQKSGPRNKVCDKKPPHSASPPSPRKPDGNRKGRAPRPISSDQSDTVERIVKTRNPKQQKEGRRQKPDAYSSESESTSSDHTEASEDIYEHVETKRQLSRQQNRKQHTQYQDDEKSRHRNRPNSQQKIKPSAGPTVRRRA